MCRLSWRRGRQKPKASLKSQQGCGGNRCKHRRAWMCVHVCPGHILTSSPRCRPVSALEWFFTLNDSHILSTSVWMYGDFSTPNSCVRHPLSVLRFNSDSNWSQWRPHRSRAQSCESLHLRCPSQVVGPKVTHHLWPWTLPLLGCSYLLEQFTQLK